MNQEINKMEEKTNFFEFEKNIIIRGIIKLKTGLHIGGLKETIKIGGTDNPVILGYIEKENNLQQVPIIPGSSLKGKIRSLLELKYAEDISEEDKKDDNIYVKIGNNWIKYKENDPGKLIPIVFGIGILESTKKFNKTRIIFRDCIPTEDTIQKWKKREEILHGTEIKGENTMNRITNTATPRFFERVPAGSKFELEIILSIYKDDKEEEIINLLKEGLKLLQDNYLGGSGSRGYGKIEMDIRKVVERTKKYYLGEENEKELNIELC